MFAKSGQLKINLAQKMKSVSDPVLLACTQNYREWCLINYPQCRTPPAFNALKKMLKFLYKPI